MKYNYPHTGNDKLMFQERFWSPAYVASNGGTVTGSLSFNNGAVFDGTAKYVDYLRRDHGFPAQWTMMADINLYDLIGDFTILSRDATSPTLSQFCVSVVGGRLKVTIGWTDGTYSTLLDQINHINVGIRQHVAVTYDGVTVRTFVCGVAGSTLAVAGKKLKRSVTAFRVGARASVGYENYFKGTIKELRVYGTALALSDFQALWLEAQGEGAALSVPPVLDGLVMWIDPRTGGTPAAQTTLVDGDMEAAGTTAWYVAANAMLSKQGSSFAGSQCLRITNAGAINRWGSQIIGAITGNRYCATGAARGDGTARPAVGFGSLGYEWNGTTSTSWQTIANDYNWTTFGLYLYSVGADTKYVEFDALALVNLSRTSITPSSLGSVTAPLVNATAAQQPWISNFNGKQYFRFASDVMVQAGLGDAKLNCLHNGTGCTVFHVNRPVTLATNDLLNTAGSAYQIGFFTYSDSTGKLYVLVANGSGTYPLNTSFSNAVTAGQVSRFTLTMVSGTNGVNLRKNGTSLGYATLGANPSTNVSTRGFGIGSALATQDDAHGHVLVYNRVLNSNEVIAMESWLATEYP